jgi:hypothetical protein
MLEVIHYQNEAVEKPLEASISSYYDEAYALLPGLPATVQIYFSDYGIIPATGVGGYAYSPHILTVSIDPDFKDTSKQLQDIRPTVFHETFHQFQGFTGESQPYPAIECAVYEGMATVFEREYAGIFQKYGDYWQTPEATLRQWITELKKLSAQDFSDEKTYQAWKFYHPKLKERWIAYKVGTWITDQVLEKYNLSILDLSTKTAAEVLKVYQQ